MKKMKKILSGVSAAALAFSSMAAYVSSAATVSANVFSVTKAANNPSTMEPGEELTNYQTNMDCIGVEILNGDKVSVVEVDIDNMVSYTAPGAGAGKWFALVVQFDAAVPVATLASINGIEEIDAQHGQAFYATGDWNPPATPVTETRYVVLWINAATNVGKTIDLTADLGISIQLVAKEETPEENPECTCGGTCTCDEAEGSCDCADESTCECPVCNPEDSGETDNSGSSSSSTSKNDKTDDKTEETDGDIEGEVDIEPGKEAVIETDAGDLTVTTAKDDTALEGTTFVVETVENAKKDLTAAVGKNASAETKALIDAANDAVKDGDAVILDLSFEKDGKKVQPGKSVTLSIPVPETLKGKATLYVYHVDEDGIKLIATPRVSKGMITFTADKFSPFIISKVELNADAPAADDDTPATNPSTGIALAIAPVVLAAGAVVVASKRKH